MRRLLKPLFWGLVFIVILVGVDQVLTRVPPVHPAHAALSHFYQDFRSRLFSVVVVLPRDTPQTVESVIEKERKSDQQSASGQPAPKPVVAKSAAEQAKPARYVYADEQGVLQFADSLDQVPQQYRSVAEPLGE